MIKLTLYNDSDIIINSDLIEFVEKTPDTLISLTTGKKVMVKESVEDVINKVIFFKQLTSNGRNLTGTLGVDTFHTSSEELQ